MACRLRPGAWDDRIVIWRRSATDRPRLVGSEEPVEARAIALLLPGGFLNTHRRPLRLLDIGVMRPRRRLSRHTADGLVVRLLRYRYAGWNGEAADTAADTRWALDELAIRYPDAPVVLIGNSLGGRAAVAAADHPSVAGVVGLAPWLPAEQSVEPVIGRPLLIIHGSADHSDAPAEWSREFAARARAAGGSVARFEVPGARHFLFRRGSDWAALTAAFALAVTGLATMPPIVSEASNPAADLSLPLPPEAALAS